VDWIAWVPEHGYFELNVRSKVGDHYQNSLRQFWRLAPRKYRYVVVDSEGTLVEEKRFSPNTVALVNCLKQSIGKVSINFARIAI